jgi:hypothetical protein
MERMEPVRLPWTKPGPLDERLVGAISELRETAREMGVDVMSVSLNHNTEKAKPNHGTLAGYVETTEVWVSNLWD